ncbi:odorant receptor 22c-like [Vespula squamosa]|uniref:Odorant receptor 22c-like n=1 Tax=Vespula squamosa TaxID=30214 RepID=A0ABD2A7F4_VESSQ
MLLAAIGVINMGLSQLAINHACAMFRILRIILENAFDEERLSFRKYNEEEITATLYRFIHSHNRVIEFIKSMNTMCDLSYTINIVFGMVIVITDSIMMLQFNLDMANLYKFFTTLFHLSSILSIGIIQSHVGQNLMDHSTDIFQETITKPWYLLPPRLQKLSLLIMMRSMKKCSLTVSKLLTVSYELFSKGLQTAVSYAMIFHSLEK